VSKIISEHCEWVKLCHINRSGLVFLRHGVHPCYRTVLFALRQSMVFVYFYWELTIVNQVGKGNCDEQSYFRPCCPVIELNGFVLKKGSFIQCIYSHPISKAHHLLKLSEEMFYQSVSFCSRCGFSVRKRKLQQ